jgi:hypothetical protein
MVVELQPGSYDVTISCEHNTLGEIKAVVVRSGEECRDPRLTAWVEQFRFTRLRVRNARQQPVKADVWIRRGGAAPDSQVWLSTDGNAVFGTAKKDRTTIELSDILYVTQTIDSPQATVDVIMIARPQVRLLPPRTQQFPEGTVVRLFDRPASSGQTRDTGVDATAVDIFRPDGPGRNVVALYAGTPAPGREAWRGEIEVKAGDAVQEIELPIGPEVIDKLRALLNRGK